MSVLNKLVSYYPSIIATNQGLEINLIKLLRSDIHKDYILELRNSDVQTQKKLKEQLPCYTVTGIFSCRNDKSLITPSGLAAVDLDSAEDYDIISLLHELKKIECIAYAGASCRGKRLFCIVPFLYHDKYLMHYDRLIQSFIDIGLPMGDNCHKRISQPRFVSWNDDTTQFFNHQAKPYHLLPPEKRHHFISMKHNSMHSSGNSLSVDTFKWCKQQIDKSYSFLNGGRHEYVIKLVRYCNLKGVMENETLKGCLSLASEDFPEFEIKKIVMHIYTHHVDSFNKLPFSNN
jgi:hypothetical protein